MGGFFSLQRTRGIFGSRHAAECSKPIRRRGRMHNAGQSGGGWLHTYSFLVDHEGGTWLRRFRAEQSMSSSSSSQYSQTDLDSAFELLRRVAVDVAAVPPSPSLSPFPSGRSAEREREPTGNQSDDVELQSINQTTTSSCSQSKCSTGGLKSPSGISPGCPIATAFPITSRLRDRILHSAAAPAQLHMRCTGSAVQQQHHRRSPLPIKSSPA